MFTKAHNQSISCLTTSRKGILVKNSQSEEFTENFPTSRKGLNFEHIHKVPLSSARRTSWNLPKLRHREQPEATRVQIHAMLLTTHVTVVMLRVFSLSQLQSEDNRTYW